MQKSMRHSLMESLPAVDAYAANHNESHFSPEQDPPHHLVMNGDALRASGTSAPPYTAIEGDKGFSPRTSDVSSITELEAGEDLTASAPRVDLSASVPSATSSSSISSSSPLLSTYGRWHIAGMLWVGVGSCGQVWALVGGGGLLWAGVGSCGQVWALVGGGGLLWVGVGSCWWGWTLVGRCGLL